MHNTRHYIDWDVAAVGGAGDAGPDDCRQTIGWLGEEAQRIGCPLRATDLDED